MNLYVLELPGVCQKRLFAKIQKRMGECGTPNEIDLAMDAALTLDDNGLPGF